MKAQEFFQVLASCYLGQPDDLKISMGHTVIPFPELPIGLLNMPEIQARTFVTLGDVRRWANEPGNSGPGDDPAV